MEIHYIQPTPLRAELFVAGAMSPPRDDSGPVTALRSMLTRRIRLW